MGMLGVNAESAVETVNVEVPDPVTVAGLMLAVTPDDWSRTAAFRLTAPLKPFKALMVMTLVPWLPGVRLSVLGDEVSVKFGPVVAGPSALSNDCPFGEPNPVTRS